VPLEKGNSKAVFGHNVGEMIASGHPRDQAVAAAYSQADEKKQTKKIGVRKKK
jgi:hypothetical protein